MSFRDYYWRASCSQLSLFSLCFNATLTHPGPTNLLHSFSEEQVCVFQCVAAGRKTLIKQQTCLRREKMVGGLWWRVVSWQYGQTRHCFLKKNWKWQPGVAFDFLWSSMFSQLKWFFIQYLSSLAQASLLFCSACYLPPGFNSTNKSPKLSESI